MMILVLLFVSRFSGLLVFSLVDRVRLLVVVIVCIIVVLILFLVLRMFICMVFILDWVVFEVNDCGCIKFGVCCEVFVD